MPVQMKGRATFGWKAFRGAATIRKVTAVRVFTWKLDEHIEALDPLDAAVVARGVGQSNRAR
jgi:hypothetical protein